VYWIRRQESDLRGLRSAALLGCQQPTPE